MSPTNVASITCSHDNRASAYSFSLSRLTALCLGLAAWGIAPAFAQPADADLVEQIQALREQQAQIAQLQQKTDESIRALEAKLGVASPAPQAAAAGPLPSLVSTATRVDPGLKISGDLRLRSQYDYSDSDSANRNSSQLRARLGATYTLNDLLTIGARVVTGDSDDPNSSDVQLSNWNDDLQISLDLAYAQFNFGGLKVYGGKIPNPFARTDLVWDGDFNPQGIGGVYKLPLAGGGALRANGLLFAVDERSTGADSNMGGVQFGFDSSNYQGITYDISGGYYRYSLGSLAGAESGDWRSNRLNPDGSFVSDYELVDIMAGSTWHGSNEAWPLRIVGNYVKNLGAIDDEDTGFGVDASLGRASNVGDWRFTYGYSQTDVDAVLAAFSQDNIGIATNYKLHAMVVDYTPMPKTLISAIWYHYKPNDPLYAGANRADDWLDRVRLLFLMNF